MDSSVVLCTSVSVLLMCVCVWCHGNFGPAKILVRGTKIPGKLVRRTIFFPKISVRAWNNGPIMKCTVGATVRVQFGAKETVECKNIQENEEIDLISKAVVQSSRKFSRRCW